MQRLAADASPRPSAPGAIAPPTESPVMTAEATTGPAAAVSVDTAPPPRTEAEVDELLRALYPPLRRRLCRDLLLDRERAGYRTDIRF